MKPADVSSLRMLRRARDRIDRDYADPIDIPALAAGAGYSREHFIRAFRVAYGETPGRYRTRRRVERACELLRSANLTVTEICHLVGFASLGTFSARFAELTGMSPTAYRRQIARGQVLEQQRVTDGQHEQAFLASHIPVDGRL